MCENMELYKGTWPCYFLCACLWYTYTCRWMFVCVWEHVGGGTCVWLCMYMCVHMNAEAGGQIGVFYIVLHFMEADSTFKWRAC